MIKTKIKTVEDANKALHRLAEIEGTLKKCEAIRDNNLNRINKEDAYMAYSFDEERADLIEILHSFTDKNRSSLIGDKKNSVELQNGTLGYRKKPDVIEVSEKTADLLISAGLEDFVKIKKEPVKAALKNLDDAKLKKYDAKRIPGEESFYVKASEVRQNDSESAA